MRIILLQHNKTQDLNYLKLMISYVPNTARKNLSNTYWFEAFPTNNALTLFEMKYFYLFQATWYLVY